MSSNCDDDDFFLSTNGDNLESAAEGSNMTSESNQETPVEVDALKHAVASKKHNSSHAGKCAQPPKKKKS